MIVLVAFFLVRADIVKLGVVGEILIRIVGPGAIADALVENHVEVLIEGPGDFFGVFTAGIVLVLISEIEVAVNVPAELFLVPFKGIDMPFGGVIVVLVG